MASNKVVLNKISIEEVDERCDFCSPTNDSFLPLHRLKIGDYYRTWTICEYHFQPIADILEALKRIGVQVEGA